MLISPAAVSATVSTSPFSAESRNSADPFSNAGQDCRAELLVVDADSAASEHVCAQLRINGFETTAASSAEEAHAVLHTRRFDLILLDWTLPRASGLELLRALRARDDRTPVFMTNASDVLEDRIHGFESGADDYLVKPYVFRELLARLRARLRRVRFGDNPRWRLGDLILHVESRRVFRGAQEIALTPREFDLLFFFVQHPTQVITRELLGREVWRVARHTPSMDNAIDVHVAHLRRKIQAGSDVKLIHTVRGRGFVVFDAQRADSFPNTAAETDHTASPVESAEAGCR
jgi:DNA-binding response OmpR family regulator